MAKENVTQTTTEQASQGAVTTSPEDAVRSLQKLDYEVSNATESISALANAAIKTLALDIGSLLAVAELLKQIRFFAGEIQDTVSLEAERFGVDYTDDTRLELHKRFVEQRRAISDTAKVAS